ncbi:hypothetical protein [Paenibacillus sp. y28]|uniref:hypothetical protein n=1 Tax=Paenibacillus sp. y28 TaxID=3129110 RepID=UPI00301A55B1
MLLKYMKLCGLIVGVVVLNILVLSPGFLGVEIGGSAFSTAFGVSILVASVIAVLYGCYVWFYRVPAVLPVKQMKTHEDYMEALTHYSSVKGLENDVKLALGQLDRMRRKKETLLEVLNQRFDTTELSYNKFVTVIQAVEKLFYLNYKSMLNRLRVFDQTEFEQAINPKSAHISQEIAQERAKLYRDYTSFIRNGLTTNEEIILKLDKLLLEISRLDSFEPNEIENMPCMREIDALINQTKYYRD